MLFMEYQTLCYKNKQKAFPNLKCSDLFRDSWKKLGKMPQQKAVEHYIQELCDLDPEWEEKYAVTDDLVSYKYGMVYRCNAWTENTDSNRMEQEGKSILMSSDQYARSYFSCTRTEKGKIITLLMKKLKQKEG